MTKIDLDYERKPALYRWLGAILLALGVAAFSATLSIFASLNTEVAALELQTSAAGRRLPKAPSSRDEVKSRQVAAEIKRANQIVDQLSFPWGALFGALETAVSDEVALLLLQPDPQKNTMRITAEAKTYDDMIRYLDRLGEQRSLHNVHLASHEIMVQDPNRPVRFTVVANWVREE